MIGIYKISNPNGLVYIGQSRNIKYRLHQYQCNGAPNQRHLYRSIKKYGWSNHIFNVEIELSEYISQNELNLIEQSYLEKYRNSGFKMMNIREAGSNGRHSEETKAKIRQANIDNCKLKGIKLSNERIQKIKNSLFGNKRRLGCKISDEHKIAISNANKGRVLTETTKRKISDSRTGIKNWMFGKALTAEHKAKISEGNRKRIITPEMRLKMSIGGRKGMEIRLSKKPK